MKTNFAQSHTNFLPDGKALDVNNEPFEPCIPGSKSYTNRALIIGAYTLGKTIISNALMCDDTVYFAKALNEFDGLSVEIQENSFIVTREKKQLRAPTEPLYIGGAGTPARFLLAFSSTVDGETTIVGNKRLNERPMKDILDCFDGIGVSYQCLVKKDYLPIKIKKSTPSTNKWFINGSVSSQFASSLILLAAFSDGDLVSICIEDKLVSKPYVEMTLTMLRECGILIDEGNFERLLINPASPKPSNIEIEVDASAMSYFLVAAAITRSAVTIKNINKSSTQGDVGLVEALGRMGCFVAYEKNSITLRGAPLSGINVDMDLMPDTVLSLAIAALFADSPTRINNIANLRVKECDRINAIVENVNRLGGKTEDGDDWVTIYPLKNAKSCEIECFDDHRVAMAFSLLTLTAIPVTLSDYDCVTKSFPDYWKQFSSLISHHS